jgi:hypothetical protein
LDCVLAVGIFCFLCYESLQVPIDTVVRLLEVELKKDPTKFFHLQFMYDLY